MDQDKLDRTIQFILDAQAKTEVDFASMREFQVKTEADFASMRQFQTKMEADFAELREAQSKTDSTVAKLAEEHDKLRIEVRHVNKSILDLTGVVGNLATMISAIANQTSPNGNP